ncbi:MAG TPA: DNA polymerase III subunit delta [Acidimicrobiales bacterium]|nr:DNA polymerase III subunit delta [Acidimicrobiales bacterium]
MSAPPAAPVYLVQGEDASLVSQALRQLVSQVAEGLGDLAVEDMSGEEPDVAAVVDACLTPPFLSERRVVILRDVNKLKAEEAGRLAGYVKDPATTTSLVLSATGAVARGLVTAVKASGHVVDAGTPSGRARGQWVAEALRRSPVRLNPAAVRLLSEHLGEDLGRLQGLTAALASAYGDGATVGPDEIAPFLGAAGGAAPWDLTDALDAGDVARALDALHRLLDAGGRHPLVVLATLVRHYTAMLRLDGANAPDDATAAEILGVKSTWQAGKARGQAARLGTSGVARAIDLLQRADLELRGETAVPGVTVLEVLVARLARLGAPVRRAVSRRR